LALFSQVGLASVWQFFYVERMITLFALINIPVMPSSMIVYFKGMQFISFDFVPNAFSSLQSAKTTEYHLLPDNAKYHPNIF
jgi:hypothetical protein